MVLAVAVLNFGWCIAATMRQPRPGFHSTFSFHLDPLTHGGDPSAISCVSPIGPLMGSHRQGHVMSRVEQVEFTDLVLSCLICCDGFGVDLAKYCGPVHCQEPFFARWTCRRPKPWSISPDSRAFLISSFHSITSSSTTFILSTWLLGCGIGSPPVGAQNSSLCQAYTKHPYTHSSTHISK